MERGKGIKKMVQALERTPEASHTMQNVLLTPVERALLRLMVSGYALEEAAPSLGLSLPEARALLEGLQQRCGVSSFTRLIVLAVLNAWV